ncbi:PKD domain-containing protein [Pseudoalteromonas spongiae]|uniref:PKD/Chitinase domain-containing protein n=1 Tax=Pseudoalteromonas spongiae TaxID=298657 RepID=A0ABU8EVV6_9GAMM
MKSTHSSFRFLACSTALSVFLYGCGGGSSDKDTSPNPDQGNRVPTVTINGDNSAQEASVVTLNAAASDSDGSISKYAWSITSGENVTLNNSDQASVDLTLPDVNGDTQITISVTVTDNDGATARDEHTLTIVDNADNQAPTVVINGVAEVDEQSEFNLTATASDNDGEIVSYFWQLISGEGVTLSDTDKAQVKVTTSDIDEDQQVTIAVMVTDDGGAVAMTQHQLLVKASAQTQVFTLKGRVNNGVNSAVNLTVGDKTVTATTNGSGEFSLLVELEESYDSHLVKLSAPSNSVFFPEFNFVSQLLTLGELKQRAGNDNILTEDEYSGVSVGAISTALYYMLDDRENITTTEQLENNYDRIYSGELAINANVLHMLLNGNQGETYPLPTGVTTLGQLFENDLLIREYRERMLDSYPSVTDDNQKLIAETTTYPAINETQQLVFSPGFNLYTIGRHYTLNPDGTGSTVLENGNSGELTWSIDAAGILILEYKVPITLRMGVHHINEKTDAYEEQLLTSAFYTVFQRGNTIEGVLDESIRLVDKNGTVVESNYDNVVYGGFTEKQNAAKLSEADFPGTWFIDDVFTPEGLYFTEPAIANLMADGSASIEVPSVDFYTNNAKWQVTNGNLEIISGSGDNETRFTYYVAHKDEIGYAFVANVTNGGQQFARNGIMVKQQTATGFNENDIVGHFKEVSGQRIHYTGNLIIYDDLIARGDIDWEDKVARVDENGVLQLETYLDRDTLELCRTNDDGRCFLSKQTSYRLFANNTNQYVVMHTESGFGSNGERAYGISKITRIVKQDGINITRFDYGMLNSLRVREHLPNGQKNDYFFSELYISDEESEPRYALSVSYANDEHEVTPFYLDNGIAYFTLAGKSMQMSLEQFERDTLTVCLHEAGATCTDADKKQLDMRWNVAEMPPAQ